MLLYTKLAAPKVPKRRSRAGCNFCKEKKKKCDERRPQCARCAERDLDCVYEAIRPRQRKKRESISGLADGSPTTTIPLSENDSWPEDTLDDFADELASPFGSTFDTNSAFTFPSTDIVLSPVSSVMPEYTLDPDEEESTEIVRRNSNASVASQPSPRLPDLAMISPCPVGSPTLDFCPPLFSEFSERPNRRALVDHFCNVLSHLIVLREESGGNPFQQLVLPLSHKSLPVMNAIYALASAHLEYRGVDIGEKSIYFHNKAIQGLARLIERDEKSNRNELLAAIMLLVYYEVLVQRGRSNIVDGHLRGALTIMSSSSESSPTSDFLERAFRFYDVITALSKGTAPLSTAPAAGCLLPFPPVDAPVTSLLSNVDTLLGMATTLWPIMHRLSNLLSVKTELENAVRTNQMSKMAVLRTEFETTSHAIEVALKQWQPCLPPNFILKDGVLEKTGGDDSPEQPRLQSIFNNAMAYRHSAFVYLYRTVRGYSPHHKLVQVHAHQSLEHCVETVMNQGPMGALLWPLFVAACEAVSNRDRALAKDAFAAIDLRQGMTNIERAWEIVQEVWGELDRLGSVLDEDVRTVDLWRKVSGNMGVTIVFG